MDEITRNHEIKSINLSINYLSSYISISIYLSISIYITLILFLVMLMLMSTRSLII